MSMAEHAPSRASAAPAADAAAQRPCSIQRSLDVLGDRWTLLILREAFRGTRRFGDFVEHLDIARPVLTERLKRLVGHGVLSKELYCQHPPRYEYRLTARGVALSPALVALMRWGDEWLADDGPPTVLVHDACGHPLDQQFVCWSCNETFTPLDIASRPGPGSEAPPLEPSPRDDQVSPLDDQSSPLDHQSSPLDHENGGSS